MSTRTSSRRLTWHSLVGSAVYDRDGKLVGHCTDLVARPVDGRLTVTHILVGPQSLFARMALARWFDFGRGRVEIPWEAITELGDEMMRLDVHRDEVGHTDKKADGKGDR